jgi:hypothetical protein
MVKVSIPELKSSRLRNQPPLEVPNWLWAAAREYERDVHPSMDPRTHKAVTTKRYRFCQVLLKHLPKEVQNG